MSRVAKARRLSRMACERASASIGLAGLGGNDMEAAEVRQSRRSFCSAASPPPTTRTVWPSRSRKIGK